MIISINKGVFGRSFCIELQDQQRVFFNCKVSNHFFNRKVSTHTVRRYLFFALALIKKKN